jgi:hypothetical protein
MASDDKNSREDSGSDDLQEIQNTPSRGRLSKADRAQANTIGQRSGG